jgi:hypothetical protein
MSAALAQVPPVTDLLDVFGSLNGSTLFPGLTAGVGGQPPILGRIGWIFAGGGAAFTLWGFVLRAGQAPGGERVTEMVRTLLILVAMFASPGLMRMAMQGADSFYASTMGGPRTLAWACARAAYAMPEVTVLFDLLRQSPNGTLGAGSAAPAAATAPGPAPAANPAGDGTVFGYLKSFGASFWQAATTTTAALNVGWTGMLRLLALANGFGAAAIKCLLATVGLLFLYLLLLVAAAIAWVMEQLRYFFAVTGTMMLPLFLGLFSLPAGHPNRAPAHAYVMHLISLALWPVAWAIGHTGTIALYNALMALLSGTSRVPAIAELLQWSSITTTASFSTVQVQSLEAALGNWFMGNFTSFLGVIVLGTGFVLWVLAVSVLGPVFLHKLLTTGALFMSQAAAGGARLGLGAVQQAMGATSFVRTLKGRDVSDLGSGHGPGASGRQSTLDLEIYGSPALPPVLPKRGSQGGPTPPVTMAQAAASQAAASQAALSQPEGSDRRTA